MISRRRVADLAAAAVLALLYLGVTSVSGAQAAVSCGIASQSHAGRIYDPTYSARGAEAEIDVRSGVLCQGGSGPATFATSWVMMVRGDLTGYAQVGHMFKNFGSGNFRFFYEYDKDGPTNLTRVFWGNPVSGNHHNYRAARQTGDGHIHFTVEGNNPPGGAETPWDPLAIWNEVDVQWASETLHIGSDIPGTPGVRVDFQFVHHKNNNETWTLQNYVPALKPCYFSVNEITSDSHFESWTNDPVHACD